MTTRAISLSAVRLPGMPRPEIALVAAVAAGAALGALTTSTAVPSFDAVTADLDLTSSGHAATGADSSAALRDVMPAATTTTAPAATAALTKSAQLDAQAAVVEGAIDRFESRIGTTRYENYCERAVENAFGTQGHYASAIDDWHARDQHSDWRHAPRGALVFYDTSADGHVALSLGDGRVVSSSAHHQVGIVPVDYFQHPLGWAPSPY